MTNEIHFDFGKLEHIFIFIIIIGLSIYFYFELRKIKKSIQEIELKLTSLSKQHNTYVTGDTPNMSQDILPNMNQGMTPINKYTNQEDTENLLHGYPHDNIQDKDNINDNNVSYKNTLSETHIQHMMNQASDTDSDSYSDSYSDHSSDSNPESDKYIESERLPDINSTEKESILPFETPTESNDSNINEPFHNDSINDDSIQGDSIQDDSIQGDSIKDTSDTRNIVPDYNSMTVSDLKNILIERELPTSGNKTKLIQRIQENKTLQF